MAFPETRQTLIRRIADGGDEAAWRDFLADYWGPICAFIARRANLNAHDAEDVASQVFEILLSKRLFSRWTDAPVAKLRTLICAVVVNVLSNRARVQGQRGRLLAAHADEISIAVDEAASVEHDVQFDIFYAAWVEGLLRSTVESLMAEYHREGKGDYFRVLYARLCEDQTMPEVAESLQIKVTSAENYFRHARQRLMDKLQEAVVAYVERYSPAPGAGTDFQTEWRELGEYLQEHGGVEQTVRQAYQEFDHSRQTSWQHRFAPGRSNLMATRDSGENS